jgi:hypothetical protein
MATPKVQLAEDRPIVGRNLEALLVRVVRENELAVGAPPDVNLDGVGN